MSGILLSAVSLVLRTVGVFFNAEITKNIGASGTGMFSLIATVITPAVTLSTAGINLAVSKIVAEEDGKDNNGAAGRILKHCIVYCLSVSCVIAAAVFLFSDFMAVHWLESPDAAAPLRILALSIPATSVSAAASGYFVAVRRAEKNAVLQLFEQFFRISITLFSLRAAASEGSTACLTAVIVCSVASDAVSCLISLLLCFADTKKHLPKKYTMPDMLTKRIVSVVLPVSVSSFLRSGLVTLEHILIPKGLKKRGDSFSSAMASYGALTGMAMSIIMFPSAFLYSFSGLLIPEFAEAYQRRNMSEIKRTADSTIRTVLIFSIGAAGILLGFAEELGTAVYKNADAARYIAVMAPLIPVMYLDTAVDSMLKGLGEQLWTMKINIVDAVFSVITVWILVPKAGLNGYIVLVFASEIFNFSFSLYRLTSITGAGIGILKTSILPLISVFGSVTAVKAFSFFCRTLRLSSAADAAFGIALSSALYFIFLLLFGVVNAKSFCGKITAAFYSLKPADKSTNNKPVRI